MKIRQLLAGLTAVAILLAGCGGGDTTSVADRVHPKPAEPEFTLRDIRKPCQALTKRAPRVSLDGHAGAMNAGFLMARQRDFFADAGVIARMLSPSRPNFPVHYVITDVDDIVVAQLPQVVIAKALGAPVTVIGSVISEPTDALIWRRGSPIRDIADLKGKAITFAGVPYERAFLEELLSRAGLGPKEVKIKPFGYRAVKTLLEGETDAIFGATWNIEGVALRNRGARPVIRRVQSLGFPAYDELVVVARTDCLARFPGVYRDFMAALARGTAAARRNPAEVVNLIEENHEHDPAASRRETRSQVEATLPLLSRSGHLEPGRATGLIAWMHDRGLIEHAPESSAMLTSEYLAPRTP
jgi:putative hydroxymethylpyrimidine transport system substrate-binding protein